MMKKLKTKKIKGKNKVKKQSFDFEAFKKSFTSLDPQNIGTWPVIVKLTLILFIFLLVGLLAYAVPITQKMEEITSSESKEKELLKEYEEKEVTARNLEEYKNQIEQMKTSFNQLLQQLPKKTKIPDLVEDINMRGVRSDIQFEDISVNNEVTKSLFIEQPIVIQATGEYHKFGNFVSSIAGLQRIVTIHDFVMENSKGNDFNVLPIIKTRIDANTYRAKSVQTEDKK